MNPTAQQRIQRQLLEDQAHASIEAALDELQVMQTKDARDYTDREAMIDRSVISFVLGLRNLRVAMDSFEDLDLADSVIAANTPRAVADSDP